jgi:hypothetical protein
MGCPLIGVEIRKRPLAAWVLTGCSSLQLKMRAMAVEMILKIEQLAFEICPCLRKKYRMGNNSIQLFLRFRAKSCMTPSTTAVK